MSKRIKKPQTIDELKIWYDNAVKRLYDDKEILYTEYIPSELFSNGVFEIKKETTTGLYIVSKISEGNRKLYANDSTGNDMSMNSLNANKSVVYYSSGAKSAVDFIYSKLTGYIRYQDKNKFDNKNITKSDKKNTNSKVGKLIVIGIILYVLIVPGIIIKIIHDESTKNDSYPYDENETIILKGYYLSQDNKILYFDSINWYDFEHEYGWCTITYPVPHSNIEFISTEFNEELIKYEIEPFESF